MKFKALLLALAIAGAGSSLAFADDGPHSGTTTSTNAQTTTDSTTTTNKEHQNGDCRRVFRGTIASVGASSFTINVLKGEHGGSGVSTSTMTVNVTPDTWVSWVGKGSISGPNVGDYVRVWGKQCAPTDPFAAVWVQASAPRPHGQGDSHSENHSK